MPTIASACSKPVISPTAITGEALLDPAQREVLRAFDGTRDVETVVPETWRAFARAVGVSLNDLERLRVVECHEGEYRLVPNAPSDMRTLELVLLLNES